jgi:hypothetical protein
MKTRAKKIKDFDTVKIFREIKNNISADIKDMNFEQLSAYLDKNRLVPKN